MSPASADPNKDREAAFRALVMVAKRLIALGYFRLEVEGLEHVPREGRLVYAQNHSGWFPLDALFISYAIAEAHGMRRAPFFATAEAALAAPVLGPYLRRLGALPAPWFRRPERLPDAIESCGIFPEGVRGNCKPFWQAYRMRDWNRGFVRVAIARDASIVPGAVLGGEECLPVAWTVKVLEPLIGSILPLPLTLLPLPTAWKLVFHPAVHLGAPKEAVSDQAYCTAVARQIQGVVQATLDREAPRRPLGRVAALWGALKPEAPGAGIEDPLGGVAGPPPAPSVSAAAALPTPRR
jgi:1-acyl-sn-glycerol-3-phosphate acyltransferase